MPSLTQFFQTIKEGMAVRAAVPLTGTTGKERFHCIYGKAELPAFTLTFPHDEPPIEQVDDTGICTVLFDFSDQTVAATASIKSVRYPTTLELIAKEIVTHTQTRSYFRVDAATRVAASSVVRQEMSREGESWRRLGDTIDLSGSGLLCSFSEPLTKGINVRIELTLPTRNMEIITALGHVVRCRKIEDHLYHVALHFDSIDADSQDKIMACCFELQRRYLRMRVRVEGSAAIDDQA